MTRAGPPAGTVRASEQKIVVVSHDRETSHMGFAVADLEAGGSDRLIKALVARGEPREVAGSC